MDMAQGDRTQKMPVYFLSHGGGPWPWMREEMPGVWDKLDRSLKEIPTVLPAPPKALLVVTSHWFERGRRAQPGFRVSASPRPGMIYDYGGFPAHTYQIQYNAPGSPELAVRVKELLSAGGIEAALDAERGFDHGTYTVTYPMYPKGDVPVVQVSLERGLDAARHLNLGRALAPLRDEGVLILGSGLSFHNLGLMGKASREPSLRFDQWLQQRVLSAPGAGRSEGLLRWEEAPYARIAHPRADHLMPLFVALGAGEGAVASCHYHEDDVFDGWVVSGFRFG